MNDIPSGALTAAAIVFVVLAELSSAATAALGRITHTEAADAYRDGVRGAARIVKIVNRRPAAMAAMAAAHFLFAACFALCLVLAVSTLVGPWWQVAGVSVAIVIAVLVALVFLSPMSLGVSRPVQVLSMASSIVWGATRLFSLVVRGREASPEESEQRQEEQLALMVERVSESTALDDDDRELLQSVFDLGTTLVREVMVPRTDMITASPDEPLDRLVSLFTRSGYSRLPVVGDSVDDVVGVVYLKDVIRRSHHRSDADGLVARDVLREAVFVPETKVIDDLMREMQADQVHIAMVVDEYGGIAGLVTIEDLVEELVGEISDEHDRAEPEVEELSPGVYRVPARLAIEDLGELFDIDLDDDDVDTAGGLFAKTLGRIPIADSSVEIGNIALSADRFEGRRRQLATIIARRVESAAGDETRGEHHE